MEKNRKNSFARQIADYAKVSSTRRLEEEMKVYQDIGGLYKRRLEMFKSIGMYGEVGNIVYEDRKITKLKIKNGQIALGTTSGCIGHLRASLFKEGRDPAGSRKAFDAPVQNIFHNREFIFLSRDGQVLTSSGIFKTQDFVQQSDYHPGLNMLISTNSEKEIFAFDLCGLKPIFKNRLEDITSLNIHEDGNVLIYSCGSACFADIRSMKTVFKVGISVDSSLFLGGHIICTASKNLVKAFDLRSLNCVGNILSHKDPVCFLQASGDVLYSGSASGELCISSPSISMIQKELHFEDIQCFSTDGLRIVVCTKNNTLKLVERPGT